MIAWLRRIGRPLIFPTSEALAALSGRTYRRALDVGCGDGAFLDLLFTREFIQTGVGTEINPRCWGRSQCGFPIVGPNNVEGKFDLLVFNDVLHHVKEKRAFLFTYLDRCLEKDGYVFIKEMSPDRAIMKYFNRLHDLIIARQIVSEISKEQLAEMMIAQFEILSSGRKTIFLYDHYFTLFKFRAAAH